MLTQKGSPCFKPGAVRLFIQMKLKFKLVSMQKIDGAVCFEIVGMDSRSPDSGFWEQQGSVDCPDYHLKYVMSEGFGGQRQTCGLASFLLQKHECLRRWLFFVQVLGIRNGLRLYNAFMPQE